MRAVPVLVGGPTAGVAFVLTHALWYRFLDQSVAIDVLGSVVLGVVAAVAAALLGQLRPGTRQFPSPLLLAAGFVTGFLLHLSLTPAFTPFGLTARGVNTVLFASGLAFAAVVSVAGDPE